MAQIQDDTNFDAGISDAPDSVEPSPVTPRVWTVFLTFVIAFVLAFVVQVFAMVGLAVWHVAHGRSVPELVEGLEAELATPAAFMFLVLPSQLAFGLAAFIPALLSPQPTLSRIGLVRPVLPVWGYPVIMIGTLLPLALGTALMHLIELVIPMDPYFEMLFEKVTLPWAVPFVLVIALAPGFMEELLFRGYVQRRLLERWNPWIAILVTSALFGIFHITPHSIANAFVIGLWLGVLAWRTGSVWPGIICHAFLNGAGSIWEIGIRLGTFPESPPTVILIGGGTIIVAFFVLSIWIIFRKQIQTIDPSAELLQ